MFVSEKRRNAAESHVASGTPADLVCVTSESGAVTSHGYTLPQVFARAPVLAASCFRFLAAYSIRIFIVIW